MMVGIPEMVQLDGPITVVTSKQRESWTTADLWTYQSKINSEPAIIVISSHKARELSTTVSRPEDEQNDKDDKLDGDLDFSDLGDISSEESTRKDRDDSSISTTTDVRRAPRKLTKSVAHTKPSNPKDAEEEQQRAHEELLDELRATHRENREQSLELRDMKRHTSQLREAYSKLRAEVADDPRKFSKHERNKYIEHFQQMEQHIAYLSHELGKHEAHIAMLTKQTREANKEKEDLEIGNRKLQRQINELSTSLTECKDDLLRLQPTHQTSDSEISERYSDLCQQIAGWIDDQTEDADALEDRFEHLSTSEDLDIDPVMAMYVNRDHLKLAKAHPDSVPLLLQYVIHSYLGQYVLGDGIYFYGLEIRNAGLLQGIEQGMRLLEPRRDTATIRRWRSESLHGLLKVDDFTTARRQQGESLAKSLYAALSQLLSGSEVEVHEDGWQELHKQVVLPAIDLATGMRLSTTDYNLQWQLYPQMEDKAKIVNHGEIQNYQLIDNATHKIVRPDSVLKVAEDGRIGIELLIVSPALLRRKIADRNVVICKPTVLIDLDEPMGKRSKQKRALGWATGWLGGDAEVD